MLALLLSLLCFCFIFFCLFLVKKVGTRRCARFHMSSFMLMLILLTFVLCCCVSQEMLAVLLSFVSASYFFVSFSKNAGCLHSKGFICLCKADVEIANIYFVLLCLSGNGGCAGVTERRQLHIFFVFVAGFCYFETAPRYILRQFL